ncbi:hypothetical protein ASE66_07010 [Bosea sp. Root483D1]|nr:hypothetical protein ASE66_07010 [Bosea sp. Root483D1]
MEQAQKRGLSRLLLRWPDRRAALRLSVARDPQVAELCEAYEAACVATEYWLRSSAAIAPLRVAEYNDLASAMEQDIIGRLSQ